MGTRNLTMVIKDGQTKVAQYGQWDGYPSGQGKTALEFLLSVNLDEFKTKLNKIKLIDDEKRKELNEYLSSIGSNDGWLTIEQASKYHNRYPYLNRNIGAEILNLVNESTDDVVWLKDSSEFAGDGLWCEWGYVIDLDKNTFEVYEGFGKTPLEEGQRFKYLEETDEFKKDVEERQIYYPIRMVKSYDLNNLPTIKQFLEDFKND